MIRRLNRKYQFDQTSTKGPGVLDLSRVPKACVCDQGTSQILVSEICAVLNNGS